MYLVYYDSGTSNTRGYLLKGETIVDTETRRVGSKDVSISGDNLAMIGGFKEILEALLSRNKLHGGDLGGVYASGMATSAYGIVEVPHIPTPVDAMKLMEEMVHCDIGSAFPKGIYLIPGVKTSGGPVGMQNICETNNVRGEETEAMGIASHLPAAWEYTRHLVVMPGSHTHSLVMDGGRITDILSTLSGEFFHALAEATVLHGGVSRTESEEARPLAGDVESVTRFACENIEKYGIARAVYIIHATNMFHVGDNAARRHMLSATVVGMTVQSIAVALKTKWADISKVAIYGDKRLAAEYQTAFRVFAPEIPELACIERGTARANVDGFLRICRTKQNR
jgi:2-keto-3-deoxy-galactonokinase